MKEGKRDRNNTGGRGKKYKRGISGDRELKTRNDAGAEKKKRRFKGILSHTRRGREEGRWTAMVTL